MTVAIRRTTPADRGQVLSVVGAAFRTGGNDGTEEVRIVEQTWLRASESDVFDLVAVEGDEVVGHILAATGDVAGQSLPAIAPLAVRPDRQRGGVGTALVTAVLESIRAADW